MREIKFRVWDKSQKKMWSHQDVDQSDKDGVMLWGELFSGSNPDVLMQYTGLKDKSGREIYEGDILKHEDGTVTLIPNIIPISNQLMNDCYSWSDVDWKVIGNIYENPELLAPEPGGRE